jgi:hypothetical protein
MKVAIAGAAGYSGRQFLHAARQMYDDDVLVIDPAINGGTRLYGAGVTDDMDRLFGWEPDVLVLALRPEHRTEYLERARGMDGVCVVEKPFAPPASGEGGIEYAERVSRVFEGASPRTVFNFSQVMDPRMGALAGFCDNYGIVPLHFDWESAKDRNSHGDPRNDVHTYHITTQECCHGVAVVNAVEGRLGRRGIVRVAVDRHATLTHRRHSGVYGEAEGRLWTHGADGCSGRFRDSFMTPGKRKDFRIVCCSTGNPHERYSIVQEHGRGREHGKRWLRLFGPGSEELESVEFQGMSYGGMCYGSIRKLVEEGEEPTFMPSWEFARRVWHVTEAMNRSIEEGYSVVDVDAVEAEMGL